MGRLLQPGKTAAKAKKRHSAPKLKELQKDQSRIIGKLRHHLLTRPQAPRDGGYSHPSEMSDPHWCHRRDYYRMVAGEGYIDERSSATMESVFEEGHSIHRKYQRWLWDMGVLRGVFECRACGELWEAVSPSQCASCGSKLLRYREVPVFSERYGIIGHADGDLVEGDDEDADPLVEFKSVGKGTLRFEAPHLLKQYTHKVAVDGVEQTWVDLEGLWRDLRRPFPRHLRQAWIYLKMKNRQEMIFIYEAKWNQQAKEFVVRRNDEKIEELLEACLDVQHGLKVGRPPERPSWAEEADGRICRSCPYVGTCWGVSDAEEESEPDEESGRGDDGGKPRSQSKTGSGRRRITRSPRRETAAPSWRPDDADGRRSDGTVRSPHSLAELLRSAAGDSGD